MKILHKYEGSLLLIICYFIVGITGGCSWIGCTEDHFEVKYLEQECNIRIKSFSINFEQLDNHFVISDQLAYDTLVNLECENEINFSDFDLIVGRKYYVTGSQLNSIDAQRICPGNDVALNIDVSIVGTQSPTFVRYAVLIPKLPAAADLIINYIEH